MKQEWEKFLNLLKLTTRNHDNYMEVLSSLNPGCTEVQIKLLEKSLGVKLPKDYIESLMIHNGQQHNTYGIFLYENFIGSDIYLSNTDVNKYFDKSKDNLIPIAIDRDSNLVCINLKENNKIIKFNDEDDEDSFEIVAKDFKDFFKKQTTIFINEVKSGKIVF